MNQPIQCNFIVKHTETLGDLRMFPISDIVTYKFYVGRLKMFEDRYEEARAALRVALKYTPLSVKQNRLRILATLIPVEMIHGIMPSSAVADTYGFHEYFALAQATIYGNIRDFEAIMQQNQRSFIRLGVYLVLEQVKVIAYRNLFRRVYTVTNNTRLRLPIFEAVMNWLGDEATLDEVECIVSNLIVQGKVKGYINHEKWTLVLSKMEPFPKRAVVKLCERISV
jgi:nuclear mRNA export protein PCID2/THP1